MLSNLELKVNKNPYFTKYRKLKTGKSKINTTPVLSDILNSENSPFFIEFEPYERKKAEEWKKTHILYHNDIPNFRINDLISYDKDEYFQVCIETTLPMEESALDNSLFLQVSRALLYKIYFLDEKYEFLLRKPLNKYIGLDRNFCFDSDIALQEKLRKLLCVYWLNFILNGQFLPYCKYSEDFPNVLEFIYQVYQISVNNFCRNKLFHKYAIDDLSNILNLKIVLFDSCVDENYLPKKIKKLKVYESFESQRLKINDCIFLEMVNDYEYKWLMPKTKFEFINSIINPKEIKYFYFKISSKYSDQKILLKPEFVKKCLGIKLKENPNLILFYKFLGEIAVHSLISLNKVDFNLLLKSQDSNEIVNYLNSLWGQNHFCLNHILKEIELNKQVISDSVEEKISIPVEIKCEKLIKSEPDYQSPFCDELESSSFKLCEKYQKSSILKFSIENLLHDVNTTRRFDHNKKIKKKVYEYFEDKTQTNAKSFGHIQNEILLERYKSNINTYRSNNNNSSLESDFDASREELSSEKDTPKKEPQFYSDLKKEIETTETVKCAKTKIFISKKRSLNFCLNSLLKLSSSSSSDK
ncbi:unnamed protein product [Brachionus calyciflorus]|uniref:Uncharacterized protein n=1 Tax=Brachionus calyciflorus TaxID=104777 RepID=A0A813RI11_9BILA|nr:unnamed protein product [Brachionus calyciflorus]